MSSPGGGPRRLSRRHPGLQPSAASAMGPPLSVERNPPSTAEPAGAAFHAALAVADRRPPQPPPLSTPERNVPFCGGGGGPGHGPSGTGGAGPGSGSAAVGPGTGTGTAASDRAFVTPEVEYLVRLDGVAAAAGLSQPPLAAAPGPIPSPESGGRCAPRPSPGPGQEAAGAGACAAHQGQIRPAAGQAALPLPPQQLHPPSFLQPRGQRRGFRGRLGPSPPPQPWSRQILPRAQILPPPPSEAEARALFEGEGAASSSSSASSSPEDRGRKRRAYSHNGPLNAGAPPVALLGGSPGQQQPPAHAHAAAAAAAAARCSAAVCPPTPRSTNAASAASASGGVPPNTPANHLSPGCVRLESLTLGTPLRTTSATSTAAAFSSASSNASSAMAVAPDRHGGGVPHHTRAGSGTSPSTLGTADPHGGGGSLAATPSTPSTSRTTPSRDPATPFGSAVSAFRTGTPSPSVYDAARDIARDLDIGAGGLFDTPRRVPLRHREGGDADMASTPRGAPHATPMAAAATPSSATATPSSAGRKQRFGISPRKPFGLSPRRPLPASMLSPRISNSGGSGPAGPMVTSPWKRGALLPNACRKKGDGMLADLLFEGAPPYPNPNPNPNRALAPRAGLPAAPSDMGAVMDGLLQGFSRASPQPGGAGRTGASAGASSSLAFSGSGSNPGPGASRHRFRASAPPPLRSISLSYDRSKQSSVSPAALAAATADGRPRPPSETLTEDSGDSGPSRPPSLPEHAALEVGLSQLFPPEFKAKSIMSPSKSNGSFQKLLEADRRMVAETGVDVHGIIDDGDGSLSDSDDGSQGGKDAFFLDSPENVTEGRILAAEEKHLANCSNVHTEGVEGRDKRRRREAPSSIPMDVCDAANGALSRPSSGEEIDRSSSSSLGSSTMQSGRGSMKKQRSVTFSPCPEMRQNFQSRGDPTPGTTVPRPVTQTHSYSSQASSSSLYGMDIVEETCAYGDSSDGMAYNTFPPITDNKLRTEPSREPIVDFGQNSNRQSFGSSGSLLAHFNNLNRRSSDVSLDNRRGSEVSLAGLGDPLSLARTLSKGSTGNLGLPLGQEDDCGGRSRPSSRASMRTPPARDLVTPPAQAFSLGGPSRLTPPPLPKRNSNGARGAPSGSAPARSEGSNANSCKQRRRNRNLCVASADKDSVKLAIARMFANEQASKYMGNAPP